MSDKDPSNWTDRNERDPDDRWIIGRAYCPTCQTVTAYVAHVEVEELRCGCGTVCVPSSGDDAK